MTARIAFTPDEETHRAIERMSRATGRPKSEIVRETLSAASQHMDNIATAAERVSQMNVEALAEVRKACWATGNVVLPLVEEADRALMALLDVCGSGADAFDGRKPPTSNTGATLVSGAGTGAA